MQNKDEDALNMIQPRNALRKRVEYHQWQMHKKQIDL